MLTLTLNVAIKTILKYGYQRASFTWKPIFKFELPHAVILNMATKAVVWNLC